MTSNYDLLSIISIAKKFVNDTENKQKYLNHLNDNENHSQN